ncbi:MAG TPA: maltotransferase domain-containing protein [Acidiphilium sp.]
MDDRFVTMPVAGLDAGQPDELNAGRRRDAPLSIYQVPPKSVCDPAAGQNLADQAVSLGFDAILLTQPNAGGQGDDSGFSGFAALLRERGLEFFVELAFDEDRSPDEWKDCIALRQELGVTGFCCRMAHRIPASVWRSLIDRARSRSPAVVFIAVTFGASAEETGKLAGCGFDFAASSSCWWDFRSGWLADDAERVGTVGKVLSFAIPPSGNDAASLTVPESALRRAIGFSSIFGDSWVMPMDAAYPAEAVSEANACRRNHRASFGRSARIVSPPGSDVIAVMRGVSLIYLANASLDREAVIRFDRLRNWLGEPVSGFEPISDIRLSDGASVILAPGETACLRGAKTAPIITPSGDGKTAENAVTAARIAIEAVTPAVDCGRFAAKRIVGDFVTVEADLISDGHGTLAADLLWRGFDETEWQRCPMKILDNDRWSASFQLKRIGRHAFTIEAWIDRFGGLVKEIIKKWEASVSVDRELIKGIAMVKAVVQHASVCHAGDIAGRLASLPETDLEHRYRILTDPMTIALMRACEERRFLIRSETVYPVDAERKAAGFASWYEIFPRSQSNDPSRHGTFADVIVQLPRIRAMGFDVLYFPPIHPIGRKNRKGRNNAVISGPDDPGSPYAIGAWEGGHDTILPELGTFDDFRKLLNAAEENGLEIALDFAIQCAPDHPWLQEHPEWFDWLPDGSIKYAENPPKKYEDIVNVDFYAGGAMPSLWIALRDIVVFWINLGIRTFRVDNPHTKPLPFWEWLIGDIRARHPEAIFLSEAFTRPKLMYRLAKLGFSQSYTYFTWRNTAPELKNYLVELTTTEPREFFRPHFFVNTPDINPLFLQTSGRAGFLIRAALAATLSGLWGVYNGFELCESQAIPGREEYLDSEKYQIRMWDHERSGNIIKEITTLNRIRRYNPALQNHLGLEFLPVSGDDVLFFEKSNQDRTNVVLVAIGIDPFNRQEVTVELPLRKFGLSDDASLQAEDLVRGVSFTWHGKYQTVAFDPRELPYCIWRVRP